jgi:hypothetical protein
MKIISFAMKKLLSELQRSQQVASKSIDELESMTEIIQSKKHSVKKDVKCWTRAIRLIYR